MSKDTVTTLRHMAQRVDQSDGHGGVHDDGLRTFTEDVAWLHGAVSEMLNAFRTNGAVAYPTAVEPGALTAVGRHPTASDVGSEAAELLIRLLAMCSRHGIDLGFEFERRLAATRWAQMAPSVRLVRQLS
jgi:NTP pyrophosphatase (non-canonical NTP hydrolase)